MQKHTTTRVEDLAPDDPRRHAPLLEQREGYADAKHIDGMLVERAGTPLCRPSADPPDYRRWKVFSGIDHERKTETLGAFVARGYRHAICKRCLAKAGLR